MGLMYHKIDKNAGAKTVFQPIVSSFPDYLDALNNLGLVHRALRENEAASKSFQTVIFKEREHVEALCNYGLLLLHSKFFSFAVDCLKHALQIDTTHSYTWNNLGCAYVALNKWKEAGYAFQKAHKLNPDDANTQLNLAHWYGAMLSHAPAEDQAKYVDHGRDLYGRLLDASHPLAVHAYTGLGALHGIQHELAIDELSQRTAAEGAMSFLSSALDVDSNDHVIWSQLGLFAFAEGKYQDAQVHFLQALDKCGSSLPAWNNLGIATQLIEQADEAEQVYKKALALDGRSYQTYNNLGNLYRQQGKYEKAQEMYRECLAIHPEYAVVYNNLALLYIVCNKLPEAEEMLKCALHLDPTLDCAHSNMMKLEHIRNRAAAFVETANAMVNGHLSNGDSHSMVLDSDVDGNGDGNGNGGGGDDGGGEECLSPTIDLMDTSAFTPSGSLSPLNSDDEAVKEEKDR
eukprot:CAMPEP_0184673108 /NCGR_PEP_ID=MMETSP0308-20130426/86500_1 /TAXON_ID=38269 /ORGANISM="Gloeochaete witrockiana, Strain SAG 46.84" /LENGTH=458 /DNA_ID=CAMNT_0027120563 /DNA_START=13 /DNA_END=1389 /DNA_ORIENTATION=-